MAIDCEMDLLKNGEKDQSLLCKISLVNENGELVFDTLVDYRTRKLRKVMLLEDGVVEISGDSKIESLVRIHGI